MTVDKFLTIREVGDILQVNERTILRLIQANKIPALKVGNQWRFYPHSQLENCGFVNGGKVDSSEMSQEENWESDQEFRVFSTNRTLLDLNVSSCEEAIEAMVGVLADTGHLLQRELYYEAVLKRERTSDDRDREWSGAASRVASNQRSLSGSFDRKRPAERSR